MSQNFTWVYDRTTGNTYIGNYNATRYRTAHAGLARRAGVNMRHAIGGYWDGSDMHYRSGTINIPNYGHRDWLLGHDPSDSHLPFGGNIYHFRHGGWRHFR